MRVLHPALILLTRMHFVAFFRRIRRQTRTLRGALTVLFFLASTMWWLPLMILAPSHTDGEGLRRFTANSEWVEPIAGITLFALCSIAIVFSKSTFVNSGTAIYFKPSDLNFLFAGPFLRRELVTLKVGIILLAFLPTSILLAAVLNLFVDIAWIPACIGIFLSLTVYHLLPLTYRMLTQSAAARIDTPLRIAASAILLLMVALGGLYAVSAADLVSFSLERTTSILRALATPFIPFTRTLFANGISFESSAWAALACAIDGLLFASIIMLDADFRETSIKGTQTHQKMMTKMRQGGTITAMRGARKTRFTLPLLPRLGGAGSIAWRQLLTAQRQSGKTAYYVAGLLVLVFAFDRLMEDDSVEIILTMVATMGIFLLPQMIRYDFRGDLFKMNWLKALPASPWAITLGQLAAPVLIASLIYSIAMAMIALLTGQWMLTLMALIVVPLFATVLFAIENLVFLHMPTAAVPTNPGDIRFMTRAYLTAIVKMIILAAFGAVAGGFGFLIGWLTGTIYLGILISAIILTAEIVLLIYLVVNAFENFDISDTPPP